MKKPTVAGLTDVDVDEVSLVDRAAVRDADDPTQPMRFYAFKREGGPNAQPRRKADMGNDMSPDIATIEGMNDRDSLQRALDDAFDQYLNSSEGRAALQSGQKRESIFAAWSHGPGKELFGRVVAATTAGTPAANTPTAEMKKGAEILMDKAAESIAKNAREHGVKLTKAQVHRLVQKADPRMTSIAMGRAPLAEEE